MNTKYLAVIVAIIILGALVVIVSGSLLAAGQANTGQTSQANSSHIIHVVAAENFWGSLVSQVGGTHVQVMSIVSDPNADPHEYETNTADAEAIANADYIIVNGAGYDSWADKLISAGTKPGCRVLNVADLLDKKEGDNPHFWYSPEYVNLTVRQMESDLAAIDPANAADYEQNYVTLQESLGQYQERISEINRQFNGTQVAATEDVFTYLAAPAGLDLISPPAFTQAVSEGNDPPAQSIVEFETQLKSGNVSVLVYNEQTVTPITDTMKNLAADEGIPVVGMTETIQPPGESFQDWMNAELVSLQNALNAKTPGP